MRTATLIVAAVSSLSLAAPALAQQRSWQGARSAPPAASLPRTAPAVPAARLNPQRSMPRPAGWKPRPGTRPPGTWQPGRPPQGGWKPGRPGGWKPGKPGSWKPGMPGRWGEKIRGRWHAGWKSPGGWGGYRRPVRGWTLPSYWIGGGFWISDWSSWGLSSPPYGYNWVRYYDDAVLVDRGGRVWDSVSGIDWDRGDAYDDERDDGYEYDDRRDYGADYDAPGYDDDRYDDERYEDDRYEDGEYRGGYAPPAYAVPAAPLRCVANCYGAGYYYGAPTTTTVVIQSAPVVTTTTVTEEVVYSSPRKVVRRAPTKKLYRAPVKSKTCYCR